MIENGGGPEYVPQQWIQEGYEPHMVNANEVKECVVCSNNYGPLLRRDSSGHYVCSNCANTSMMQRPPHRGQKAKPSAVSQFLYLPLPPLPSSLSPSPVFQLIPLFFPSLLSHSVSLSLISNSSTYHLHLGGWYSKNWRDLRQLSNDKHHAMAPK